MNFDKFMDDILLKEERKKDKNVRDVTPQREHVKRYREFPNNRIVYTKKKEK